MTRKSKSHLGLAGLVLGAGLISGGCGTVGGWDVAGELVPGIPGSLMKTHGDRSYWGSQMTGEGKESAEKETGEGKESAEKEDITEKTGRLYRIRNRDCLSSIAARFNTTVKALKKENRLTSDLIRVGQILRIPDQETKLEIMELLKGYRELRDEGTLTEEQYQEKIKPYLDRI